MPLLGFGGPQPNLQMRINRYDRDNRMEQGTGRNYCPIVIGIQ